MDQDSDLYPTFQRLESNVLTRVMFVEKLDTNLQHFLSTYKLDSKTKYEIAIRIAKGIDSFIRKNMCPSGHKTLQYSG
jgi:hypothetical protein